MIRFPNAKINLGLHVTHKREDGYHNIESIFYPVHIKDALEIIPAAESNIIFNISGITVDENTSDNLCMKAVKILQKDYPRVSSLNIHLHKTIPVGAGLGGGSSDAVACLQMINDIFQLHLTDHTLHQYALQLGSDCPFFVLNKPAYVTGRGENLEEVNLDLSSYNILIVHPGLHSSTRNAFDGLDPKRHHTKRPDLKELVMLHPSQWRDRMINDFEEPLFKQYPESKKIQEQLYDANALYASMTGSGSAIYGIFNKNHRPEFDFPKHYYSIWN